jgi:hypothetical protein
MLRHRRVRGPSLGAQPAHSPQRSVESSSRGFASRRHDHGVSAASNHRGGGKLTVGTAERHVAAQRRVVADASGLTGIGRPPALRIAE